MRRRVQLVQTPLQRYGELNFESAITHSGHLHVRTWAPSCKLHEKYYAINFIARFVFFSLFFLRWAFAQTRRGGCSMTAEEDLALCWPGTRVVDRACHNFHCLFCGCCYCCWCRQRQARVCDSSFVAVVVVVTMFPTSLTILVRWYFNHASAQLQIFFVIYRSMVQLANIVGGGRRRLKINCFCTFANSVGCIVSCWEKFAYPKR